MKASENRMEHAAAMGATEPHLLRYIENGDVHAFQALVKKYEGMVYSACQRVLRNSDDAEDVAQNCFLLLASKASEIKTNLGGWLHQCATRMAVDFIRKTA